MRDSDDSAESHEDSDEPDDDGRHDEGADEGAENGADHRTDTASADRVRVLVRGAGERVVAVAVDRKGFLSTLELLDSCLQAGVGDGAVTLERELVGVDLFHAWRELLTERREPSRSLGVVPIGFGGRCLVCRGCGRRCGGRRLGAGRGRLVVGRRDGCECGPGLVGSGSGGGGRRAAAKRRVEALLVVVLVDQLQVGVVGRECRQGLVPVVGEPLGRLLDPDEEVEKTIPEVA